MPARILLLADDLTGACDAAVHFGARGLRTTASVSLESADAGAPVCAINLDSRDLPRAAIPDLMARVAAHVPISPETIIFKKIDSVLRGNAGIETAEAMRAFGCDAAVFTPALPALGRTVENGVLQVIGSASTEISAYLRGQGVDLPCSDAACDADLDRLVADALDSTSRVLFAGSSGLAAALARALVKDASPGASALESRSGPIVFAIGSTHPATTAQLEALAAAGRHDIVIFPVPRGKTTSAEICDFIAITKPAALVLSGGDTAALVCRALGAERIDLAREIVAGIPCGVLRRGMAEGLPVATKSGGFGAPDALIQVADFFRCLKNQTTCPPSR